MNTLIAVVLTTSSFGADPQDRPNAEQLKLLKTFRAEFLHITPGSGRYPKTFMMGSEKGPASERPIRKVQMTHAFYIAKYEVPQNLWEAVMGSNPSRWKGPRNSVEMLSFQEAEEFCRRCTKLMRAAKLISDKQQIRLPSEAEWEYTARAGTTTVFSFGDDVSRLGDYGWSTENASGNDPPVGAKKPNPWGLYDVHGYLWEWCSDHAHKSYSGAPLDEKPWVSGGDAKRRVIRGGSWKDPAMHLTSSFRDPSFRNKEGRVEGVGGIPAATRDDALGLRCVLTDDSQAASK